MMCRMRTTVTLDPDVADAVKTLMRDEDIGFKEALNRLVRRAARPRPTEPFHTPTFDLGAPTVSLDKALALTAALEDEETASRLAAGR